MACLVCSPWEFPESGDEQPHRRLLADLGDDPRSRAIPCSLVCPGPEAAASKARAVGTDEPQCEGAAEKTSGNSRNSISETTSPTAR
jgi:hypothetical protein